MSLMHWPGSRESGSALAISLLALVVLVTAGLSWEAVRGARTARATAEGVLRDYASFAAVQFGRETQSRLEGSTMAGLTAVRHRVTGHSGEQARAGMRDCDCTPPAATETLFAVAENGVQFVEGPPLDPALLATLIAELPRHPAGRHVARMLDDGRLVVTSAIKQSVPPLLLGFVAGPSLLEGVFNRVMAEAALLPGTLVEARNTRPVLTLRVLDEAGRQRYRSDDEWSAFSGRGSFPPSLVNLHVEAAIKPAHASQLVIGGLPGERWPVVIGLLALAAGLVTAAAVQLRREIRFARQRADFISGVSHELRTPLAQIRLFGETLQLGRVRSPEEAHRAAEVIVQESRRLSQMVDNVLLFSRAGRRSVALHPERVDVAALVSDVAATFKPQASSKQMTIEVEVPTDAPVVGADPNVVRQVLLNFLDNAVKYGPRGQRIRVGVESASDGLRLTVADEGPGIAAADRHRIWKPFWRATGLAEGGTGLGLAIVRELTALHGGTVAVESAGVRGARFVATFAAAPVPTSAAVTEAGRTAGQPV